MSLSLDARRGEQTSAHPATPPRGVQLRRTKGWRMPANTIKVCRPGPFGNPFLVAIHGQAQAVALHRLWLLAARASDLGYTGETALKLDACRAGVYQRLPLVRGLNMACFCPEPYPGEPDCCHRAALLELANR